MFAMLAVSTVSTSTDVKAITLDNSGYQEVQVSGIEEKSIIPANASVKQAVTTYFAKTPVMIQVARCESTFRHFDKDGNVLLGKTTPADIGVMQINRDYHGKRAAELGIDLSTIEGNMKFAALLYKEQGTAPWSASKACWSKSV